PRSRTFLEIRKIIDKRIRHAMHLETLQIYMVEKNIPKGFQLSIQPSLNTFNANERQRWDDTLSEASLKLMDITTQHHTRMMSEKELEEEGRRADGLLATSEKDELKRYEQKRIREIRALKEKKFVRDNISSQHLQRDTGNIVNLSSTTLSQEEVAILSKGLSFSPATGGYDEFQLYQDLDNFSRSLRLQEYFHERPSDGGCPLPSNPKKHWTPSNRRNKYLDMYIEVVQREIMESFQKKRVPKYNLSLSENNCIKLLGSRTDIVIKPADKGGAVVVLNTQDYINEGLRQLNDPKFYKKLSSDPTLQIKSVVLRTLSHLKDNGGITREMFHCIKPWHPRPGRFYTLPKIHKENNPGRPIVSGIGTVTERISSFIDTMIKEIPPTFPSFLRDTNHFIRDISQLPIPTGSFLVTLDVTALYTNIPHDDGIAAVIGAYVNTQNSTILDCQSLTKLLRLVLECNHFEFENEHYLQISGTAMGTKMAPNYANIFMAELEGRFLADRPIQPYFYRRYIDDIFMIWTGTEDELNTFISEYNSVHSSIRFTHNVSQQAISFLDVTVEIQDNKLSTKLYRKPTDRQQYLNYDSCHPRHCKNSLPYSQAHRYKRICSNEQDFKQNADNLTTALIRQNYPPGVINSAIEKASRLDRTTAINKTSVRSSENNQYNLVLTYASNLPNINNILRKNFNILSQNQRLQSVFPQAPRVVYRRGKSLKDMLVRSKTTHEEFLGSRPCRVPRCKVCSHMTESVEVKSTNSDFTFRINGNYNCNSANVVYLLHCRVCNMQYIGQTDLPFRQRFNNHKSHLNTLPKLPLSKHMRLDQHHINKIFVTILQSGFSTAREREQRESYLIKKFNTLRAGINESAGLLSCL
ncbi:unnamed protein product, partial [Ixodes persulcatus]